jgi:membrane protein involved in colicin uptake
MVSHSVLLVIGGALLTVLLGALVFGSNETAEERRLREERKLLRALEAQRRIRNAQLARQARRSVRVTEPAPAPAPPPEPAAAVELEAEVEPPEWPEEPADEKRENRRARKERKAIARAERAARRAADEARRREAKELARELARAAAATQVLPPVAEPEPVAAVEEQAEEERPLSDLPLFSWAYPTEDDEAR